MSACGGVEVFFKRKEITEQRNSQGFVRGKEDTQSRIEGSSNKFSLVILIICAQVPGERCDQDL